jgi:hypothetical protein
MQLTNAVMKIAKFLRGRLKSPDSRQIRRVCAHSSWGEAHAQIKLKWLKLTTNLTC